LRLGVLGLMLWPHPAAAVPAGAIWLSGAEIQALKYEAVGSQFVNIDTTTKHSGAASFAIFGKGVGSGFSTPTWGSPVTSGTVYISAWVYIGSNACPVGCNAPFMLARAGGNGVASFRYNQSSSSVTFSGATAQIGTGYTITTNAWHLYEMKISIDADTTADDVVEGRIDGAVRSGQTTNTVDTGTTPVNSLRFVTPNISNFDGDPLRVDDIIVTSDDYVGMDGHVIMRTADGPGFYGSGSSTVAFNGCSSYASCWSDVPPSSTTFANDGTGSSQNGIKFLATIADFDVGAEAMTATDTLFGCRGTWTIAKGPNGVNRNWEMLRRMDSTATEINIPSSGALNLTTSFDRWDDLECTLTNCGPWGFCSTPPCTGDVDQIELGGFRNSNAQAKVEEIGDVYVSCAYRRVPGILIKTLSGTIDLGWQSGSHDQAIVESLANPVSLTNCVGTTQTTCDLSAQATGKIRSVSPSTNGGVPSCIVTTATDNLTGSITYTGTVSSVDSLEITLPQKIGIYNGASFSAPCPTCSGANLGDSGTCQGGANDGQPCVVDGTYGTLGNTSASCPPVSGALLTTMFPSLTSSSTGSQSLAATQTCTGHGAIGLCHCDGQTYANGCNDQVCDSDETCGDNNGGPFCFPDPIVRDGSTSPLTIAGVGCIPATTSSIVNSIVGLPGPIGIRVNLQVSPLQ